MIAETLLNGAILKVQSIILTGFVVPNELNLLERGEWGKLNQGIGGRTKLNVHFDSKGILWIFFGEAVGVVNKVWTYDIQNDLWRWVLGFNTTTQYKNWGTRGVAGADVYPGYLRGVASAIDKNDNIWFFGGRLSSSLAADTFFHYNTATNEFTWIDGGSGSGRSSAASLGEMGIASPDVWPGKLAFACMQRDSENNLWLIGGQPDTISLGRDSVFHYNTTTGWWTWIFGNPDDYVVANITEGVYGGRTAPGCTIDTDDKIWLFGGSGNSQQYNDLWSFDTKTRQWQVEFEGTENNGASSVVTNNTFAEGNVPATVQGCAMVDRQDGTLMIAAGYFSNQVWVWHKTDKLWKFTSGTLPPSPSTLYETRRQPGSSLGLRGSMGHESGLNSGGQLIMVGGDYTGTINDMWIIPQDVCMTGNLQICDPDASCTYSDFYPVCTCNEGFEGDGRTCTSSPSTQGTEPSSAPSSGPSSSNNPSNQNSPGQTTSPGGRSPSGQFSSASQLAAGVLALVLALFCL